jgi:hypothetical protein
MRWIWALASLLLVVTTPAAPGAEPGDRLARFAELGRRLSESPDGASPSARDALLGELFAVVDAEIIDNLAAGGPFASPPFIQERLDAFAAAWGGASFQVRRLEEGARPGPLLVGVFALAAPSPHGSIRAYGRGPDGRVDLLAASSRDGTPAVHPWPPARDGAAQLLTAWTGVASGPGGRPIQLELWRRGGREGLERIWSSAAPFPDGLWALGLSVTRGEIAVRYEPRYPGWKPGCDGQTEQIDVFRADARRGAVMLARRRVINGWHRELQVSARRLVSALAADERAALAALVPDRGLRARLPRALTLEPACDQPVPGPPAGAVVAATEERDGRMVPWSLAWRKIDGAWRLTRAAPMLQ